MPISRATVEHIARLSRIALPDAEAALLTGQLDTILRYIEKLDQLDTASIPAMSHVLGLTNVFREDMRRPSLAPEDSLANAPAGDNGQFQVPKII
ncbi:MAG: Asp-tRNA(Asn)/Glu-tRNA(Gln) amidotransferase subunit GatC [Candidatus Omnitrophica bacterium]|nr:Asp-tRNA(Asn)/Glu-tRNA(Gln) amidotransferase subunit GatC [Candidatus Omnitrophota bacterium]